MDVPDVLGVGWQLEEVEEGGGGGGDAVDATIPRGGCDACPCTPLVVAAAATTVRPGAGLLLLLPLPLVLELVLALPLLWLAVLLLELDDDLKEERRFWAEDFLRIDGRAGGCGSEFEEGVIRALVASGSGESMVGVW